MGARAAASEHPLEPSSGTTGGRGLGHVPWAGPGPRADGQGGATCRWAGPGPRAGGRGRGSVRLSRHLGDKALVSGRRARGCRQRGRLCNPRCAVCVLGLWEPCCSHSGWERTWRRLERPQSRLDLACFPPTNRGPRPWTLSGLGGALAGARPRGPRLPPGLEDGLSVWAPDAPGSGREEALPSRLSLPRLPRSSNGQCRPAVKSVAQASGL